MNFTIYSKGQTYNLVLEPLMQNLIFTENNSLTIDFSLNVVFNTNQYLLPYKVLLKRQQLTIIDEDTYRTIGSKDCYVKTRELSLNIYKFFKEHSSDNNIHVLVKCIALLSTYVNSYNITEVAELKDNINHQTFFLKKDNQFNNNLNIQYQIDGTILQNDPSELNYAPQNCKIIHIYQPIFKGTIVECEELLFDNPKLIKFRKSVFEKEESQRKKSSTFDRREADRDTFYALTDGQLGSYDDFSGNIDDVDTWSRG